MLVPVEGAKSLETMTRKACKKTSERGVETRNESKSDDGLGNQVEEEETRSKTAKVSRPLMGGTLEERNRLSDRGILLISHLPPGFLEPQLKRFFTQFGQIKRLRLIRSKKTGGSKSYAFIEFELKEVAAIVCQTMHGYMMFGRVLKCQILTHKDVPEGLFSNYVKFPKRNYSVDKARQRYNNLDSELTEAQASRKLEKEDERRQKIKAAGIDYEPPALLRN